MVGGEAAVYDKQWHRVWQELFALYLKVCVQSKPILLANGWGGSQGD
jgi:hypothetical protein